MRKVIVLRGLPGSGKSTYAKKLLDECPGEYKRINRDDMRLMFDNGQHSSANEKFVKQVRDMLITKALEDGKSVIVDDTNLSVKNINRIKQLVEEYNTRHEEDVTVELKEIDTPLEECIARDAQREKPVGKHVIKRMHNQFFVRDPKYISQNENLPKAIVCDMDGTLALLNGRNPYDALACDLDLPHYPVIQCALAMQKAGYKLILVSGRKDDCREQTVSWLKKMNIEYEMLLMRGHKDNRKDSIIKREIYENFIRDKFYIEFVLDDRNQVVDMWRKELGIPCFQVFYGDF